MLGGVKESPLIPSAMCPSSHAWPARWRLKSRRTWLSVELVLPGWFEADVSFLHLLTLWLLDVFVPLSLCTHHLVINIADQLLGSLERKDKHQVDGCWGKGRDKCKESCVWGRRNSKTRLGGVTCPFCGESWLKRQTKLLDGGEGGRDGRAGTMLVSGRY